MPGSGSTPGQAFPIPVAGDNPDLVDDIGGLAKKIEKRVMGVYADASVRDSATTAMGLEKGMFAFTRSDNQVWYFDGAAWINFPPMPPAIYSGPSVPDNSFGNNNDVFFQV